MRELARVTERNRAVALARHYRDVEGLSGKEIAKRLGRSHATIRGYFYDPDASKARAAKLRYRGTCEGCGASTSGGDGPGRARRRCPRCVPRRARVQRDQQAASDGPAPSPIGAAALWRT